jgi:hypothetical protein
MLQMGHKLYKHWRVTDGNIQPLLKRVFNLKQNKKSDALVSLRILTEQQPYQI